MKNTSIISVALTFAILAIMSGAINGCSSATSSGNPNTGGTTPFTFNSSDTVGGVLKNTSSPMGMTYAQWSVAWWQWTYGTPATQQSVKYNALLDGSGSLAGNGQTGAPVFFLCGRLDSSVAIRTVSLPSTSGIFFPVTAFLQDTVGYGASLTPGMMQTRLSDSIGFSGVPIVSVDGVAVPNLNSYLVSSGQFTITLPNNNLYQYFGMNVSQGTISPALAYGYYVMLAPLSKGTHHINFNNGPSHQTVYTINAY